MLILYYFLRLPFLPQLLHNYYHQINVNKASLQCALEPNFNKIVKSAFEIKKPESQKKIIQKHIINFQYIIYLKLVEY